MEKKEAIALVERMVKLTDPRVIGRCDHDLVDIVVLSLCAVMCGAEGWDDIEEWGKEKEEWLRQYLKLRNGIAGHDTIRRVFEVISPQELETQFAEWAQEMCGTPVARIIAIDGKSLRGSGSVTRGTRAIHMVSAYAAEYGLTLGQRACEEKSNEITAIKELLPSLQLKGAVVTIDAMGCQTAIAQQVIDGKGDYVLAVKDNQPTLAEEIRHLFDGMNQAQCSVHETADKGHGRLEIRRCTAVSAEKLDAMGVRTRWTKLNSVARIESERECKGKLETDVRYVISSLPPDASSILHAVRTHWGIENGLHWCLDVTFREDASQISLRNAAKNFSFLRRSAINLFRADSSRKCSLPKKRKAAAWNHEYLAQVLGLKKRW
ncbi:MAG: ISAs1 family transposase [Patescibacteria group bacterium]